MMRIYAAADLHGQPVATQTVERAVAEYRPDIVVLAGDITRRGGPPVLFEILNRLGVPVLMVHGNSDPAALGTLVTAHARLQVIHLQAVTIDGVSIVGVGGTLPLPFYCRLGLRETEVEARASELLEAGGLLVTHAPPFGERDRVLGRLHAGSRAVRRLVQHRSPALVICGHIHEQAGLGRLGDTLVVNCAVGAHCGGALIDYDGSAAPECRMLPPG
jgi:uncharacterized protein